MAETQEPIRFEDLVSGVEEVVARLQSGAVPLHEALELYERGFSLLKQAQTQLESAHEKLELLKKDAEGTP